MGFREAGEGAFDDSRFFKFEKVGATITGKWESFTPENRFGKPEFGLLTDGTSKVVSPGTDLTRRLNRAFGGMANVPIGTGLRITFIGTQDVGQPKPMKVFRLEVDDATLPAAFTLDPEPEADDEIGY